jgi:hypothetical protein
VTPHRRRHTIHTTGRPVEVPTPPPGLSAARRRSWDGYWRSESGMAAAASGDHGSASTLWALYRELDRIGKLLRAAPAMTTGSMGQERVNPLAARHMELTREIRQQEKALAIGGPVNRAQLGEVEVDPVFLLAKMYAQMDVPRLRRHHPHEGFDMTNVISTGPAPQAMSDEGEVRLAAERLRNGEFPGGRPGAIDPYHVIERAEAGEIDLDELRGRAEQANEENEAALLEEWKRMLAEAQQGYVPNRERARMANIPAATPDTYRLALIDVLEEYIAEAAEHGVAWADAAPWRKEQLRGGILHGQAAGPE